MVKDADSMSHVNPFARPTDHHRLDELLDRWAVWIRAGGMEEFEVRAAGFWASGSSDFDSMVHAADSKESEVVNAAISDLDPIEQISISHIHLHAMWRSNRRSMEDVYLDARANLSEGLRRRLVD